MTYEISKHTAVQEPQLRKWLMAQRQIQGTYADGRIDWHNPTVPPPIVMCTLAWEDKILLLKRSDKVGEARLKWSLVNGYIDKIRPPIRQARREIGKETGIQLDYSQIQVARAYVMHNPEEKKQKKGYNIYPCLATLGKTALLNAETGEPRVVLDWEHVDSAWVYPDEVENYDILEDLPYHIDAAIALKFRENRRANEL